MLILTRRLGETICIGEDITVTVLGIHGSQIRLGVNAPKDVAVHRKEIFERIQLERLLKVDEPEMRRMVLGHKAQENKS